jgi:hypothetical protein
MPILFTQSYQLDILTINPHLSVIYVESHSQTGGGRQMSYLRNHLRGLSLTLRENFSTDGYLTEQTEGREKELREIRLRLENFSMVCLPIVPLEKHFEQLHKRSPRVEKFVTDKISEMKNAFIF